LAPIGRRPREARQFRQLKHGGKLLIRRSVSERLPGRGRYKQDRPKHSARNTVFTSPDSPHRISHLACNLTLELICSAFVLIDSPCIIFNGHPETIQEVKRILMQHAAGLP
jgi:hypothetical protein